MSSYLSTYYETIRRIYYSFKPVPCYLFDTSATFLSVYYLFMIVSFAD